MSKIPFLKPSVVRSDTFRTYFEGIDRSNIYSNFGPLNSLFERRIIDEWFDEVGSATTVANATLGLITAIASSRRPKGRFALMPSFTFAATPLAAMWCGLEPYFIDIREGDLCMEPDLLFETVDKMGDDVAIVIPYAAFGTHCDLSPYRSLLENGVPVVVDAAASFGTRGPRGQFGQGFPGAVVFSFHATKTFGIGEGGLVYSNEADLVNRVRRLSNFGFTDERVCVDMGLNAKLSEYAAAIGLATLDLFRSKIAARQEIHGWYVESMQDLGMFDLGWEVQALEGSVPLQFMTVLCPKGVSGADSAARLSRAGIDSRTYFSPACHRQDQFRDAGRTSMAVTENIARRVLSLPLWEGMTRSEVDRVIAGLTGV